VGSAFKKALNVGDMFCDAKVFNQPLNSRDVYNVTDL